MRMYSPGEGLLDNADFLLKISDLIDESFIVVNNKRCEYYNIPAAFDIEVSSFYEGENKRALMYIWQFGIYNYVTTGRTWNEFVLLCNALKYLLSLSNKRRLVVYVHNLPYEFQFMRKRFKWEEVFILSDRKPVYCNAYGIEFRCSLKLAGGKSLESVGDELQQYKIKKLVGNLDYNVLRTPLTPLTEAELAYCENDIRVLLCYIQEKIEQDGSIINIPLTNTGYVRNYCRRECYKDWRKYRMLMSQLTIEPEEYSQLKRAFQGGFTHANAHHVNKILHNVGSHDFTSSYPAVMLLEKFPMTKSVMIKDELPEERFVDLLHTKCCMFELELWGVVPKLYQEHPISRSKCYIADRCTVDNGRIVSAEHIKLTVTEQDYYVYSEFYDWDEMAVSGFRYYEKNYLPKNFVLSILKLYEDKTKLKDVEEEELNYMIQKNMLNAAYGMSVTDPVRDELKYIDNMFFKAPPNLKEAIEKYNNGVRRFLFYPWGVWVTAYARANLFSGIIELGNDYVYADTDSVKSLNTSQHAEYFKRYDEGIIRKIEASAEYFRIPKEIFSPKNRFGSEKTIGIWSYEGRYNRFKTLGAKRYLTQKGDKYVITLAGANKKMATEFLVNSGKPFENFSDGLTIPPSKSGRLILTYIDDETEGDIVDCNGVPYHYHELSSVHMENSEYHLSQSEEFIKYLKGLDDFGE